MYGGQCTSAYFQSALNTKEVLTEFKFSHDWLVTTNESLIQRARNTSVATFLKTDFERLLFIDADIEFTVNDIQKLWDLDVDVAVAAYSMKRPDKPLSAWENGKLVEIEGRTEPFEVDYAGTGFMMIKRKVFEDMHQVFKGLNHQEGHVEDCHAWFNPRVNDGIYLSEDYAFCKDYRSIGGKVILDPTIKLGHWGSCRYG
jgi:hypothetical protein